MHQTLYSESVEKRNNLSDEVSPHLRYKGPIITPSTRKRHSSSEQFFVLIADYEKSALFYLSIPIDYTISFPIVSVSMW